MYVGENAKHCALHFTHLYLTSPFAVQQPHITDIFAHGLNEERRLGQVLL